MKFFPALLIVLFALALCACGDAPPPPSASHPPKCEGSDCDKPPEQITAENLKDRVENIERALSPESPDGGRPARYWRDDPSSNEYGPLTLVVWVQGIEGSVYHRMLCPRLHKDGRVPIRRPSHEGGEGRVPCALCNPDGR